MRIKEIKAREILDSRGNPTVEVDIFLNGNAQGRFATPSGASTGKLEALELRDGDTSRYFGKGVQKAIANIYEKISPSLLNKDFANQRQLDEYLLELDGTENKSNLGANALLPISMAFAKAYANHNNLYFFEHLNKESYSLPLPLMNVINGGVHADNNLSIQEIMIAPATAPSFKEALRAGAEIFHSLKEVLHKEKLSTLVGDEGGVAPNFTSHEQALDMLIHAIKLAKYTPGVDVFIALDVAANELFNSDNQLYSISGKGQLTPFEVIDYLSHLCDKYPIFSIEDPLQEGDWDAWQQITKRLGQKIQIVGDDLFVTNTKLLSKGIDLNVANAILIKPNQIGTLTETSEAITKAQQNNYNTIMSHRSGETEDYTIADLAVAFSCRQIKTGSLSRSDRLTKYNQLLRIEEYLGKKGQFVGKKNLKLQ